MALFDFLKKKRKQEKEARVPAKVEQPDVAPEHVEKKSTKTAMPAGNFVLITPHITERARASAQAHKYTFRIKPDATKRQVRDSVQRFYNVHVTGVQIVKVHEKPRRRGLTEGVKKGYKKAVVALREGEAIDIF